MAPACDIMKCHFMTSHARHVKFSLLGSMGKQNSTSSAAWETSGFAKGPTRQQQRMTGPC